MKNKSTTISCYLFFLLVPFHLFCQKDIDIEIKKNESEIIQLFSELQRNIDGIAFDVKIGNYKTGAICDFFYERNTANPVFTLSYLAVGRNGKPKAEMFLNFR